MVDLAAAELPRVFDRFYRVAGVGPRGSGLGLAVVAAIISAHDGRYGVESELGKGSVSWIELPAAPTGHDTLGGIKRGTEMATIELTAATFEQVVAENDIVLVDFWAAWCGPCRMFAPVYETASAFHPELVFGKVDTEAERDLAAAARIMSIPTLMVFREGILLYAQPGAMPAQALDELIGAVKAADMDAVRAELAEQAEVEPAESPA